MKRRISRASAALAVGVMLAQYGPAVAAPEPPDVPRPQEQILERPLNGEEAIRALGADLETAAAINGLDVAELARDLRHDETMWIDPTGVAFFKEPLPPEPPPAVGPEVAPGPFPNSETFLLHSRPGADRVIYLDFDGQVVSGTAWNSAYGVSSTQNQPSFDLDGSSGYSQSEHDAIQSIFLRVAEDFAPFDVDVTTQDPGSAALNRSSSSDNQFGARVLISNSWEASGLICGNNCGGVAYLTSFGRVGDNTYYQPAWVFPHMLSYGTKAIAEAASHEAGHTLGLSHDGTPTLGYYAGHNGWAPIMGVGYNEPIVQWSAGEYADASNLEDDFAVMQSWGAPLRTDDFGDLSAPHSLGSATSISGLIGTAADVDVFSITRACTTSATFTAYPASVSPNLDIRLRLLNNDRTLRAVDDPTSSYLGYDTAAGMGAVITQSLPAGTYLLEVSGVGRGTPTNGYSDYASVGQYSLAFNACSGDTTAPTLIGRSPAVNATGVAVGVNVTARFSEQVQGVDTSTFVLRDTVTDAVVPAAVSLHPSVANKWVLNPSANLVSGRTYAVVLTGGSSAIRDAAGNAFATRSWSFTTA